MLPSKRTPSFPTPPSLADAVDGVVVQHLRCLAASRCRKIVHQFSLSVMVPSLARDDVDRLEGVAVPVIDETEEVAERLHIALR